MAARAAVTMLVALLAPWGDDRLDHAAYATFGAFASVYGGPARSPRRWRLQAAAGAVLVLAVGSGAATGTLPARAWAAGRARRAPGRRHPRGPAVAAGLLVLPLPALSVIVLVAACQALTELLVPRHYGAALVFITPLALLIGQLANRQPVGELLVSRLLETVIGVGVGVAFAIATRERR
ncbi:FUSC family protein [Dactylosporangium sp. CA-139066]|uniref:FUSC family protein n=1 Tax=Dactylosporangium sp. CA-139066 TaxID=3239930 RepID=UPI003D8B67E9